MAETTYVNAGDLTVATPASGQKIVGFNGTTEEGYQIDYDALADAILDKLTTKTYSDLSNQTIVTSLASLNTALTITTALYSANIEGVAAKMKIQKYGRICIATIAFNTASASTQLSSGLEIYTITDAAFMPASGLTASCCGRTSGGWSSASYYHIPIVISTDGTVVLRGKESEVSACTYVTGSMAYISNS